MLLTIAAPFAAAAAAPWLFRAFGHRSAAVLALVPALMTAALAAGFRGPAPGEAFVAAYEWAPSLGVRASFALDGLSRLFALLVTGIGTLILIYTGPYMAGRRHTGRLLALLLFFLGSMLGLVLAGNVLTLYVFWELTSISSYLLIGFEHEKREARDAALQALLVTSSGGLALLGGLLLLGNAAGTYELAELASRADAIAASPIYPAALALILLGAFTKSAHVPFHFWLPNAMQAPTPVSAYLHSSTMVKAGLYLLARLSPVLGGTALWWWGLTIAGATTMVAGAALALASTEFKRILAYSTISALGLITLFIGLGTPQAATAAVVFLLAHAFYKGTLFLVAGIVAHEAHATEVTAVGGLARAMPLTAAASLLAALSMAGLPPFVGFVGKELAIEAALHAAGAAALLAGLTVLAGALLTAVAGAVGIAPFFAGAKRPERVHEAPAGMWGCALALAAAGTAVGLAPAATIGALVANAAAGIVPAAAAEPVELALWHGLTPTLLLSTVALVAGVTLFLVRRPYRRAAAAWPESAGLSRLYERALDGLLRLARAQTGLVQRGYLRWYLLVTLGAMIVLTGSGLVAQRMLLPDGWSDLRLHEAVLAGVILAAATVAVVSTSRLGSVAALGVVGYGVALIFALFGAPDLAMTQFVVETLTVILLVYAFFDRPPRIPALRTRRWRDLLVAAGAGAVMSALAFIALDAQLDERISSHFLQRSQAEAHGANVVNVILVDFRALDTLGELSVLAIAALGVYSVVKLRGGRELEP